MTRRTPRPPLFPYTTLFRSIVGTIDDGHADRELLSRRDRRLRGRDVDGDAGAFADRLEQLALFLFEPRFAHQRPVGIRADLLRSEEHTSELQSRLHLVCRLL